MAYAHMVRWTCDRCEGTALVPADGLHPERWAKMWVGTIDLADANLARHRFDLCPDCVEAVGQALHVEVE